MIVTTLLPYDIKRAAAIVNEILQLYFTVEISCCVYDKILLIVIQKRKSKIVSK